MPTLKLKLAPLHNPDTYLALAESLTDITVRTLGKRREVTAVVIDDLPAACWYIGGRPLQRPTALLEIEITAGTNTPAQKESFIAQAHAALRQLLAAHDGLEEASYVIVHELPAGNWGYDGLTQQARRLDRLPRRQLNPGRAAAPFPAATAA